jgi:hypothetical protein
MPIAEIEPPKLLTVLRKVEKRGALQIAKRLCQTVGQVFRYGIVMGRAKRDPAVDLKGALRAPCRQAHHKLCRAKACQSSCGRCPTTMARRERDWRCARLC